ncbi:MAG: lamin tail domain-containing protein [Bacteroidetes bacterium]|nr:lamin tail domain-containing protein [Bacteroidota bacterium]
MTKKSRFQLKLVLLSTIFVLYGCGHAIFGQIADDFSDGNFTQNPAWQGDTAQFKISTSSAIPANMKPALQLDGTDPDTSFLCLENNLINNVEWTFWVKLSFNTSANNFARIYLISDQDNLEGPLNGYFIQIGGANDSLCLFRQTDTMNELILKGEFGFTGNSINTFRIKITRDDGGLWELFSDPEGGTVYQSEGAVFDNTHTNTEWFGIFCQYTASNASKFYFDDFYVGPAIYDTIPPEVLSVEVLSDHELDVLFTEAVTFVSAGNTNNYSVNNGIGHPLEASPDNFNTALVHLDFSTAFVSGQNYWLVAESIEDMAGNVLESDSVNFEYLAGSTPGWGSIYIDEIMADPEPPPAGIPAADFLELYNATNEIFDLTGCSIKPRESADPAFFESGFILPDSFLIVTHSSDTAAFSGFGQVAGLSGFSLNNEGTIVLRNAYGDLLHAVSYTRDWYKNEEKKEGGWSLEMIDPLKPCAGMDNWMAAMEVDGGTPGRRNSVNGAIYSVPTIELAQITGPHTVRLEFNHDMDSTSIVNPNAYKVMDPELYPTSVTCPELHFASVQLEFDFNFAENNLYTLKLTDSLFNCSGEFIPLEGSYTLVLPSVSEPWDIVINEIMADPDPPVGLPEFEFIEVFNATEKYLNMQGWTLEVGTVQKKIPDLMIGPAEYILFTDDDATWLFEMFGRAFGFSSLGLTNSGAALSLLDESGTIISTVTYTNDWFRDADKAEGGWSLEQIDPYNPCAGKENWSETSAPEGGTPGKINSVDAANPSEPKILSMIPETSETFKLSFSQVMDKTSILNPDAYYVDHTIGNPFTVVPGDSVGQSVILTFSEHLLQQKIYELQTEQPLYNCRGLEMPAGSHILFGISQPAEKNDIVINEVLFNPAGKGVDFVEIYNRSDRIVDMKEFYLGNINSDEFGVNDTIYKNISIQSRQFLPGEYLVLTTDPEVVKSQYYTENPDGFFSMSSFPAYSNQQGSVVIAGTGRVPIDYFNYNESMHYPLLTTVEGVSLERINYDRPSGDKTNWHSASGEVGYATPAYRNSQFKGSIEIADEVTLEPETFSPDNDGWDDVLNIHYQFDQPGFNATIRVFDSRGRLTRLLIQNELLGTEGTFSWDGLTDDNRKAPIGIYIIYFEVFDLDRNVKKYKKTAVLGGRL